MSLIHYIKTSSLGNIVSDVREYGKICHKLKRATKEYGHTITQVANMPLGVCPNPCNRLAMRLRDAVSSKYVHADTKKQMRQYAFNLMVSMIGKGFSPDVAANRTIREVSCFFVVPEEQVKQMDIIPDCEMLKRYGGSICWDCRWTRLEQKYFEASRDKEYYSQMKKLFWISKFKHAKSR